MFQDIVWHGFKESCTARMIQRTAISSPHSGMRTKKEEELVLSVTLLIYSTCSAFCNEDKKEEGITQDRSYSSLTPNQLGHGTP